MKRPGTHYTQLHLLPLVDDSGIVPSTYIRKNTHDAETQRAGHGSNLSNTVITPQPKKIVCACEREEKYLSAQMT